MARCFKCNALAADQRVVEIDGEQRVICYDEAACQVRQDAARHAQKQTVVVSPREAPEAYARLLALAEQWRESEGHLDDEGKAIACLIGERVQFVISITSAIVQGGAVISAPIGPAGRLMAVGDTCCIVTDLTGRPTLVSRKQFISIEPQTK